ncbi:MAG: protease complex subunit PrcB family protein [Nanoarchaeota archaeon]|nr:protease complex subunit PrcB family protein [Nanoarchaeota archaeon]
MNKIFLILIIGIIFVSGCTQIKKMDFETISKGHYSDHKEPANYIINSNEELESLGIKIPEIDFSQFSVIAVFMGEFNTGGYSIEIIEIIEKENEIIIKVNKTYPKPGSLLTQAFSQPHHIIKIKRTDKPIIFEEK